MNCLVFLSCFVILGASSDTTVLHGICSHVYNITKATHLIIEGKWELQEHVVTESRRECCTGYQPAHNSTTENLTCEPICEPQCQNSTCIGPNNCFCKRGHVKDANHPSVCRPLCQSCVNSACHGSEVCECFPGFEKDGRLRHVCHPVCSPPCVNGTCEVSGVCRCLEHHVREHNSTNVCKPTCKDHCVFGVCTGVDVCTCFSGYKKNGARENLCEPVCSPECENGKCVKPDECECNPGFIQNMKNPNKCVEANQTLTLCNFTMSSSIRHDAASDCFLLNKGLLIEHQPQCSILSTLVDPQCVQADSCEMKECELMFRCVTSSDNDTDYNEIRCGLHTSDFKADENMNMVIADAEWRDFTIVLSASQQFRFHPTKGLDVDHRKWTLRASSDWPICKQEFFGVAICGVSSNKDDHSEHSVYVIVLLILVLAICAVLAVVIRHRAAKWRGDEYLVRYGDDNRIDNPLYTEGRPTTLPIQNNNHGNSLDNPLYIQGRSTNHRFPNNGIAAGSSGYNTATNADSIPSKNLLADLANPNFETHSEDDETVYEEINQKEREPYDELQFNRPSKLKIHYQQMPYNSKS